MNKLQQILESLEPPKALDLLAPQLKKILSHVGEEARMNFVSSLIDGPGGDKVSSMVNL